MALRTESGVEMLERYLQQQHELLPADFYILRRIKSTFDRLAPPYEPPESGSLEAYEQQICDCMRCPLGKSRTHFVFGAGHPDADLFFVGEAPGYQEDMQGEPFVGRAGQLLDDILKAIHLQREEVYIANVLKCRPPENRDPRPEEIQECEPYLIRQIRLVAPKVIIALGRVAGNTLLRQSSPLRELRGKTWNYEDTDLIVTYHPAALLRNDRLKRPTWEDFQKIQEKYLT
ncbi:MAG TPA: uracil-DNA glycosylase [bacterium]|nr:uracil-DNA glycosylase [bacterium]